VSKFRGYVRVRCPRPTVPQPTTAVVKLPGPVPRHRPAAHLGEQQAALGSVYAIVPMTYRHQLIPDTD
jgi:hypothetical protein